MRDGREIGQWWREGLIYQIYPRSFMDSNGDGIGDLPGITSRLDDLHWLGIDAVWISPIYASPMADFGYDVSDHTAVHPMFGTLNDVAALVQAAHDRGIRVVLDYVPNHTSNQHHWFLSSRSGRDDPKRDWYIWRDAAPDGGPPNNWRSVFGGSAWEWDAVSGQYYYHAYLKEQPDLNWRNPEVRAAMLDVLRFWLDRGVDGFRVDALRQVIKDDQFRDNPDNPDWTPSMGPYDALLPLYTTDRPEVQGVVRLIRSVLDAYDDRVMIGELYLPIERLMMYYGMNGSGCHLPSNFHLIGTPWDAREIARLIDSYEAALPAHGWPNWVLGNHDRHRIASRVGPAQARVAAMLLLTLRGTPTLYYGDEIGMRDVEIPPDRVQDPWERNVPGIGLGRDPERTPMQWDASPQAGFTTAVPWLPVSGDFESLNVATEQEDPDSMLSLYRSLTRLRRREAGIRIGSYVPRPADGNVLAYERVLDDRRLLIVLNFGNEPARFLLDELLTGTVLLTTTGRRLGEMLRGTIDLAGDEGIIAVLATNAVPA
jgi:alpha-glucosidase